MDPVTGVRLLTSAELSEAVPPAEVVELVERSYAERAVNQELGTTVPVASAWSGRDSG